MANWGEPSQTVATNEQKKATLAWRNARDALNLAKEAELKARNEVLRLCFTNPREGTNKLALSNDAELKLQHNIKREIIVPNGAPDSMTLDDAISECIEQMRLAMNEGAFLAERLFKVKTELSATEYKKLPDKLKIIVDRYVSEKPGSPQLSIKE